MTSFYLWSMFATGFVAGVAALRRRAWAQPPRWHGGGLPFLPSPRSHNKLLPVAWTVKRPPAAVVWVLFATRGVQGARLVVASIVPEGPPNWWLAQAILQRSKLVPFSRVDCTNYKNLFVTQYITYLNIWEALSRTLSTHEWLVFVWYSCRSWFLPSTGFEMNSFVKWSAGGISKFIMLSLFLF